MASKVAPLRKKRQRSKARAVDVIGRRVKLEEMAGDGVSGLLWTRDAEGRWYLFKDEDENDESELIEKTTSQIIDKYEQEMKAERARRIGPAQAERRLVTLRRWRSLAPEVRRLVAKNQSDSGIARILSKQLGERVTRKVVGKVRKRLLL